MSFAAIGPVINTQSRILASPSGANRVAEEATLSQILDFIGSAAQGDILYRDNAAWARLAAGTAGQFLKTLGAGNNPAWDNVGCVKLNSGSVSSAASLGVSLTSYTGYSRLELCFWNFVPATDDVSLYLRSSTNGGSSYDSGSSDYQEAQAYIATNGVFGNNSTGQGQMRICHSNDAGAKVSNVSGEGGAQGRIDLLSPSSAVYTHFRWHAMWTSAGGNILNHIGGGRRTSSADVDAVQLIFSSGNIASGNWALYGYP